MGSNLDVLEDMETVEGEESENGDGPRVKCRNNATRQSTDFFRRRFGIPYKFLMEFVQLAKHRKCFALVTKDVAGRQCGREAMYTYL